MSAETIAHALGGRRAGATWMARCPAHNDGTPSLAVREGLDGKVLIYCHAGCSQSDVITALKCDGIWTQDQRANRRAADDTKKWAVVDDHRGPDTRTTSALRLWNEAVGSEGTLVEIYLRTRGLTIRPPATLRFHPALRHPTGGTWPAMVALVTGGTDGKPTAIHRTFLTKDGSGKAPVSPQKMMLGPCLGGVVRLGEADDTVMAGEGIETCLSAMQATGRPTWAALSTAGLRSLQIGPAIANVTILADRDEPGEAAARSAARRWSKEGRRVCIARPPIGKDFNDALMGVPQSLGAAS